MSKLIFTRGLPGSGKTTWARNWVAEDLANRARVNRDDFRGMMHSGDWVKGVTEKYVIAARDATISALLKSGVDVVNDDTNLPQRMARDLRKLAEYAGAEWEVKDFTHVDLDVCIWQDGGRANEVGVDVITELYNKYIRGKTLPLPLPEEPTPDSSLWVPYIPDSTLPKAIIVDIDGTTAIKGDRDIYDDSLIHLDTPNAPVVKLINLYRYLGYRVLWCSGRGDGCRQGTWEWLQRQVPADPKDMLFMRKQGDNRKDSQVKYELFDEHIRNNFYVEVVLDDRNQVVEMWRAIGLTCFQVAEGNF